MPKWLIEKLNNYKEQQQRKQAKKALRKKLRQIFSKKNLTKALIIVSGLMLIASYTLPYIL